MRCFVFTTFHLFFTIIFTTLPSPQTYAHKYQSRASEQRCYCYCFPFMETYCFLIRVDVPWRFNGLCNAVTFQPYGHILMCKRGVYRFCPINLAGHRFFLNYLKRDRLTNGPLSFIRRQFYQHDASSD